MARSVDVSFTQSFKGEDCCRGLQVFKQLTHIEELDLSDTGVEDLGLQHLSKLKQLNTLNISYSGDVGFTIIFLPCIHHSHLTATLLLHRGDR